MKTTTFSKERPLAGMTLQFFDALRAEFLKSKRSLAVWLTVVCSLFIPLVWMLAFLLKSESLLPRVGSTPWDYIFMNACQNSTLLLPFFIILIVNLIVHIEHRADAWKLLYVQPVPRGYIYFSKLLYILLFILGAHLLFLAGVFLAGFVSGLIIPEYRFLTTSPDLSTYSGLLFRSVLSVLGITGLQYAMSYLLRNFSIPFGAGLAGTILSIMAIRAEEVIFVPYAYPMLSLFRYDAAGSLPADIHYYSIGYFLLFVTVGFLVVRRQAN